MAVPKRKTSQSKKGMRRSHHTLKQVHLAIDPESGEKKLRHHISLKDGTYRGKQILVEKTAEIEE